MHTHNNLKLSLASLLTLSLISHTALASDQKFGLHGNGEAGFSDNTGNTVSTNIYGALKLNYIQARHETKSLFELDYKSENKVQTQERYLIDVQNNRFYNDEHSYFSFVGGQLEKSRFEGIELAATLSLGLGKSLLKNKNSALTAEVGLGQKHTNYTSSTEEDRQRTQAHLKLDYYNEINLQSTFTQDAKVTSSSSETTFESNTGVKVKIADQLNLKITYKLRHNDTPPQGVKKLDTATALTLIYDF